MCIYFNNGRQIVCVPLQRNTKPNVLYFTWTESFIFLCTGTLTVWIPFIAWSKLMENKESLNYLFILSYLCFFFLLLNINEKQDFKHFSNTNEFESYCFEKKINNKCKNRGKLQLNSEFVQCVKQCFQTKTQN